VRRSAALLLSAVALAGCGGSSSALPPSLAQLYEYDRKAPFRETDRVIPNTKIPVVLHDISFSDARGGRVHAYLCVPPGKGPFAGVALVPGSGGRQADFLIECLQLAAKGAVAMSMITPFVHGVPPGPSATIPSARYYRAHFEDNVVAVRRALDLLQARKDVDPSRLGLAGWSLGGALASVVSGVDPRVKAAFLVAPPSHAHFVPPLEGKTAKRVYRILAPVDPKRYLPHARGKLFVAMGLHDEIQTRSEQRAVIRAAGPGAKVVWFPTGHEMNVRTWADLVHWLGQELGLGPLPKYAQVSP
jgi:cephalosporin-C deacetylase-like acetyl esterase